MVSEFGHTKFTQVAINHNNLYVCMYVYVYIIYIYIYMFIYKGRERESIYIERVYIMKRKTRATRRRVCERSVCV